MSDLRISIPECDLMSASSETSPMPRQARLSSWLEASRTTVPSQARSPTCSSQRDATRSHAGSKTNQRRATCSCLQCFVFRLGCEAVVEEMLASLEAKLGEDRDHATEMLNFG